MRSCHQTEAFAVMSFATAALALLMTMTGEVMAAEASDGTKQSRSSGPDRVVEMTLDECIDAAMQNSHRRPASLLAVAMAEAQHRQALAGYWPQVSMHGGYQRMDESPNFLFPATSFNVTIPKGTFGNPVALEFPITVPKQDIKLMDPSSLTASVDTRWLLYDGGMRKGLREQSGGWLEMAKQDSRRTDLEIVESVKRLYYGAVLAWQLHRLGKDTLARMEATLSLTEAMYKEGSGKVMKTDYLDNKVVVESLRSAVALLEKNEEMSRAALANTMGLPWNESVRPAVWEIPFTPYEGDMEKLVGAAYRFSPDWARLEAAIRAAEGAERTAKSGHYPKLAVMGELHRWWNDHNAGLATDRNKEGWSIGVGVEIPIFEGFLTTSKVKEAKARLSKTREEQFLLKEGIGLQIKDIFLGITAARKSHQASLDAMTSARENSDLSTRAYQNELIETEKVIRAQLIEALMSAQHYKTRYDHIALQSQLDLVVGTEVSKQMEMQ